VLDIPWIDEKDVDVDVLPPGGEVNALKGLAEIEKGEGKAEEGFDGRW
jgi:hypothetical protein